MPAAYEYDYNTTAAAVRRALAAVNDRPKPGTDALCSPQNYVRLGQDFQSSAWRHLDEGDLPQASNKAWAIVAETVKAISAYHGGVIHTHRAIWEVVEELAALPGNAGDAETERWIMNSFTTARALHANFYEDWSSERFVLAGLMLCEELSARLCTLFWPDAIAVTRAA